ncbi:MAG: mechanosensitive ion channel [Candidatus Gastranaerophilales bacterium]|nr:mechanosensitive ion channel [Candidatus Gastranaerophilales bacterium]
MNDYLSTLPEKALGLGLRILFAVVFFLVGVQLVKLVGKFLRKSMERAGAETGVTQFVGSFVKTALYVLLVFLLASYFGVDAASIVALLGSAGVAIGLAVQGSLSNLAGGVLILLLKPFVVGDYICESATGREGTVSEIQIFYTKLMTPDNKIIVLPNGGLANTSIVNVTAAHIRRMDLTVGISYRSDLLRAKEALLEVLESDEKVMKDKERLVFVDDLAASAVNLGVRCWFRNEDYWEGKWRVTENCKLALDAAGVEIPYQQLDVHLKEAVEMLDSAKI